jgi:flagellar hook-associated protein 3 FlgL
MSIRITDNYLSAILVGDLNRSLNYLFDQQRIAGSLKRVNSYADDPRAVGSIHRLNALIQRNDQYRSNVSRSRTLVDSTDDALQTVSDILADIRVLALRESSALASPASMGNAVVEADNLMGRLLEVLNTSIEGTYLFAGRNSSSTPFTRAGGTVSYLGDDGEILARTGPNSTLALNIPGSVFMGSHSSLLQGTVDLAPRLDATTPLADLNLGAGWNAGSISIANGNGGVFQVDLTGALTVADVLQRINTGTSGTVTAAVAADGTGIQLTGTGPLTVAEVDGGTTANSLGLAGTSPDNYLDGDDLRPALSADTLLSDIAALAGNLPLGSIQVAGPNGTTTVDLSNAVTAGDLRTAFNNAAPGLELVIDGAGLRVTGSTPDVFTIASAAPGDTAGILGLAGQGRPVRLFGLLEDLQASLAAGDKDAVASTVNELLAINTTIAGLMVKTGGRQESLDWAENILVQRDERLRTQLSLEADADVAQLAANLSRAESSYQASLLVTSKLFENNLMMYLR